MRITKETYHLFIRYMKKTLRTPPMIFFALVQPLIWLLLFSQLFDRISVIPNFPAENYLSFFVPGVILMTALFSGGQSGMAMVMDMNNGFLEKLLIAPISRSSILIGKVLADAVRMVIQSLIILGVAYLMGFRVTTGFSGVLLILLIVIVFGLGMAGLSVATALLTKNSEAQMMMMIFINMPMMFLSTAMMPAEMLPSWMETAARFNPVSYGVTSIRSLTLTGYEWGTIFSSLGVLSIVAVVTLSITTLLFRRVSE